MSKLRYRQIAGVLIIRIGLVPLLAGAEVLLSRDLEAVIRTSGNHRYFDIASSRILVWEEMRLRDGEWLPVESVFAAKPCEITEHHRLRLLGTLPLEKEKIPLVFQVVRVAGKGESSCAVGDVFVFRGDFEAVFVRETRNALRKQVAAFLYGGEGVRLPVKSPVRTVGDVYLQSLNVVGGALPFFGLCVLPYGSHIFVRGKLTPAAPEVLVEVVQITKREGSVRSGVPLCTKHTLAVVGEGLMQEWALLARRTGQTPAVSDGYIISAARDAQPSLKGRWLFRTDASRYGEPCFLEEGGKTWPLAYESYLVIENKEPGEGRCPPRSVVIGLAPSIKKSEKPL